MNLRGTVLPVIEARPLLGLAVRPAVGPARALVLADDTNQRAAILIERVLGLAVFENVNPPAAGVAPGDLIVGDLVDEAGDRATVLGAAALLRAVRRAWIPPRSPRMPCRQRRSLSLRPTLRERSHGTTHRPLSAFVRAAVRRVRPRRGGRRPVDGAPACDQVGAGRRLARRGDLDGADGERPRGDGA